jgi:hypothetical protein
LLEARKVLTQLAMASGSISKVPQAPMPPAFATEAPNAGVHALPIGAIRIGTRKLNASQKAWVRARADDLAGIVEFLRTFHLS